MNFAFSPLSPEHNTSLFWDLSVILVKSGEVVVVRVLEGSEPWERGRDKRCHP